MFPRILADEDEIRRYEAVDQRDMHGGWTVRYGNGSAGTTFVSVMFEGTDGERFAKFFANALNHAGLLPPRYEIDADLKR